MRNRRDNKRIIGLVLEELFTDFSKELIQSVTNMIPSNKDIQLIVFALTETVMASSRFCVMLNPVMLKSASSPCRRRPIRTARAGCC